MTTVTLINLLAFACSTAILWRAEPALARMGSNTYWMIRYAMLTLAGGALGTILNITAGGSIDITTLLVLVGVSLLLASERRISRFIAIRNKGGRHA